MIEGMKTPHFIRPLTEDERSQVQTGLRSSDAFVLRRCQILLASARGERAGAIAMQLGCHKQTVLTVIHDFNANGLAVLEEGFSRPHLLRTTFSDESVRRSLGRLGTNWERAKHWITSPDPQYLLKKTLVIG